MEKQRAIAKAISGLDSRFLEEAAQKETGSRKRLRYQPFLAAAACLLLAAGLTFFRPMPLKVTANGENVLENTVTYSMDAVPMTMERSLGTRVSLTIDPGKKGAVTLTSEEGSALSLNGEEAECFTLTEKTPLSWILYPGSHADFTLRLTQGEQEYTLRATLDENGCITICQV